MFHIFQGLGLGVGGLPAPPNYPHYQTPNATINLDSERGNFKFFGFIYWLYLRKFELLGGRLLKKRDKDHKGSIKLNTWGLLVGLFLRAPGSLGVRL